MRIGELARELGVSTDTLRFYERSGLLPRTRRGENGYRDYGALDLERTRLLLSLRRLDLPLDDAARLADWCQSGHCDETSAELPRAIAAKRAQLHERMAGLAELDGRLAVLERHLNLDALPLLADGGPCCAAAGLIGHIEQQGLDQAVQSS